MPRRTVTWSLAWITSSAVILLGIAFGFVTKDVHSVTEWIVSALVPAFVAPNVLKWHWWRFNGYGFFAGMVAGTGAALVVPGLLPHLHEVFTFLIILAISAAASVLVCLLTKPEADEVLEGFYRTVRPWGFWGPVLARCRSRNPAFQPNRDFRRDAFNIAGGPRLANRHGRRSHLPRHPTLAPVGHLDRRLRRNLAILKFTWYDKLGPADGYLRATDEGRGPDAPFCKGSE